jgi:hypothetical protein
MGGALNTRGFETVEGRTFHPFFGALGGSLIPVLRLGQAFEIVVDATAGLSLNRHRFRFAPDDEFFEMDWFHTSVTLTLGVGFQ